MQVVAVDIGGTHARFAIAEVEGGRVVALGEPSTQKTAGHASLQAAWEAFGAEIGKPLPRAAAIAVAAPVSDVVKLTNNSWIIRRAELKAQLDVDDFVLINDFGAVGHAVAQVPAEMFEHLTGPDVSLPERGVITIVGPGTGLGVAQILREKAGYHVLETEGGHPDFAPLDSFEDTLLHRLRKVHGRVSSERVAAGPGIVAIYETLAAIEGRTIAPQDDTAIWKAALDGSDPLAHAALDRFCLSLGAVAGDRALAQGGKGVVIAGGLGLRIKDHIARSGFAERFAAKGRFRSMMEAIPVKLITHPQPGLFGAAAAFAQEHTS
jgi:glucokinase